jgi:hypothetical protein
VLTLVVIPAIYALVIQRRIDAERRSRPAAAPAA